MLHTQSLAGLRPLSAKNTRGASSAPDVVGAATEGKHPQGRVCPARDDTAPGSPCKPINAPPMPASRRLALVGFPCFHFHKKSLHLPPPPPGKQRDGGSFAARTCPPHPIWGAPTSLGLAKGVALRAFGTPAAGSYMAVSVTVPGVRGAQGCCRKKAAQP